jgi:septum formation protein
MKSMNTNKNRRQKKMIIDKLPSLLKWRIILASTSPRRQEIFKHNMGLTNIVVKASTFDETSLDKSSFSHPSLFVMENAKQKALQVQSTLSKDEFELIVSADTIVCHNEHILEKPLDTEHAKRMLKQLSGNEHVVYTGVCFILAKQEPVVFFEETFVQFDTLSDSLIDAYVQSGEPMDKAGGYGIQDRGGSFVSSIKGCYFNVMGFPLHKFTKELATKL